jgi:hypothetical protein
LRFRERQLLLALPQTHRLLLITNLLTAQTFAVGRRLIGGCRLNHNLAVLKHKIAGKVMLPANLSVWLIKWTDSVLL